MGLNRTDSGPSTDPRISREKKKKKKSREKRESQNNSIPLAFSSSSLHWPPPHGSLIRYLVQGSVASGKKLWVSTIHGGTQMIMMPRWLQPLATAAWPCLVMVVSLIAKRRKRHGKDLFKGIRLSISSQPADNGGLLRYLVQGLITSISEKVFRYLS